MRAANIDVSLSKFNGIFLVLLKLFLMSDKASKAIKAHKTVSTHLGYVCKKKK
jgi:hypothetical protein